MDTNELKFLLKLLGCSDYRSSYGASIFNSFKGKDKICLSLGQRDVSDNDIEELIDSLCQENKVRVMGSKAKAEEQLIFIVAE